MSTPLVLYVDDEPANRLVFERTFGGRYRVVTVASGEDALARLDEELPAVLVADQRMPGMSGTELLEKVRERSPDTVRVILTAYADPGPMLEAINRAGASRYIVKPWSAPEMQAVLDGALEAHGLGEQLRALQLELAEAQRFGSLGVLTASVAHDMASPLSALVANMARLERHAPPLGELARRAEQAGVTLEVPEREAAEEVGDIARESRESATYLAALVSGMRGQARPAGEQKAEPARVLAYVLPLLRGLVTERGGRIELEQAPTPPVGLAPSALTQVLLNLGTNAAQSLSRDLAERRLALRLALDGEQVRFEVQDTGTGMSPEQVARAGVERFTTKPEGQGTGLGLTIVRKLVEGAGGRLEIESTPGTGTTVRFWLPQV